MSDSIKEFYLKRREDFNRTLSVVCKRILLISVVRFLFFVAGVAGVIVFYKSGFIAIMVTILFTFVPFMIFVKYHGHLYNRRKYLENSIEMCSRELRAIDYDWTSFKSGKEFADSGHFYSNDLDLFGDKSLYRMLNRTVTPDGSVCLAEMLKNILTDRKEICLRSAAVKELSEDTSFRMDYIATGLLNHEQFLDIDGLKDWGHLQTFFYDKKIYELLPPAVFSVNIVLLILGISGFLSYSVFGAFFSVSALISFVFSGRISKIQAVYGKRLKSLETYAMLLSRIENSGHKSDYLCRIRDSICSGKKPASVLIAKLSRLMNELDQRNNFIVYFILNGLFFWELRQIYRIEKWKSDNMEEFPIWIKAVAEYDALCSLGTYAFNNPSDIYPEIADGGFVYEAKGLGHPMMRPELCVCNDISIKSNPYFIIVTGANMAGKSTYLRTVGVNYLFACMGLPVRAESMRFSPVRLITSLRTTDSLMDNESYFFAELKRLKMIMDILRSGEKMFIILDEILKGTNSVDKQKGSMALVSQLIDLGAVGIIATHDLILGTLHDSFHSCISNFCFEADISGNELSFSYRIREGIAQNMNACFLMNRMGIATVG